MAGHYCIVTSVSATMRLRAEVGENISLRRSIGYRFDGAQRTRWRRHRAEAGIFRTARASTARPAIASHPLRPRRTPCCAILAALRIFFVAMTGGSSTLGVLRRIELADVMRPQLSTTSCTNATCDEPPVRQRCRPGWWRRVYWLCHLPMKRLEWFTHLLLSHCDRRLTILLIGNTCPSLPVFQANNGIAPDLPVTKNAGRRIRGLPAGCE